jgi:catechol 2,3-dioxygenase
MSSFKLHPDTQLGWVHLKVSDIVRSLDFYREKLGFHLVEQNGERAVLSASSGGPAHIFLDGNVGARPKPHNTTGLYHVAIRLPDQSALARVISSGVKLDRIENKSFVVRDPDGNGIELLLNGSVFLH